MSKQEAYPQTGTPEKIDLTVTLNNIFRIIRKNFLWLLLAVILTSVGCAGYRKQQYVPAYTASSTFIISTSRDSQGTFYDTSAARQMAKSFPYILTSDILQRQVARELELDYVPGTIEATVMESTNFLTISVTDSDPARAYHTLQALLKCYPTVSGSIIGQVYMELMDETGVPTAPSNPRSLRLDLVNGAFFGMMICIAAVVLVSFTDRTIRCEDDCLKRINCKCLGLVPWVRAKVRSKKTVIHPNILRKHADPEFVEAFRIIRNKVDHRAIEGKIRTMLITSTFAGEGKSTSAVNLALALAQEDKRVALVDCDLRHPSDAEILGAAPGKGLIDFLRGTAKIEDCTLRGEEFLPHRLPLLLIRGGEPVADGSSYLSGSRLKALVTALEKQMDYVILDTPPAGLLTDAGILGQYAQGAVYVVKKDYAKADKILEGMEHLTQSNTEIIGCILNSDL